MTKDIKELKKLFEAKKKSVKTNNDNGFVLDKKINEIFGFHYSETDDDEMIDTLDYGSNSISFETFLLSMNFYKEEKGFGIFK